MAEQNIPIKRESENAEHAQLGRTYVPSVDISETEDALWLWVDMPGVGEDSIDVHLEDDRLSIEGRVSLEDYESLTPIYTEYNVGNFERSFRLSSRIDIDQIHAKMNEGTLEIKLPKAAEAQPRKIKITTR